MKLIIQIPCLNEDDAWIHALADLTHSNLGDWVSGTWNRDDADAVANASRQRAIVMGASDTA